jgi:hypothetical protein
MPAVSIKTGIVTADGSEEILSEYLCDSPGCPNIAEHVMGVARDLATAFVVCAEHASVLAVRAPNGPRRR